jgi:hypothetical protein
VGDYLRALDLPDLNCSLLAREALGGFIDAMWRRVQDVGVRAMAFSGSATSCTAATPCTTAACAHGVSEAQVAAAEAFQRIHGSRDIGFAVPMNRVNARSR